MRKQIEAAFPQCLENNCIEELTDENIFISDQEEGPCQIVSKEGEAHLVVRNPNKGTVNFLKIDKCLFSKDSKHKKCDCVVFDNKLFCFVEIKSEIKSGKRQKRKREARAQLKETIEILQEKLDFTGYEQKAVVCLTFQPARPLASTSSQEIRASFQEKYNVTLREGNELTF